jgi:hypothetical protein
MTKRTAALWIAMESARFAPKDASGGITLMVTLRQEKDGHKFFKLTNL